MEELLKNNILKNKQFMTLSPDYVPSGIILRMQMRRTQVKSNHNYLHSKNDNGLRKSIRKPKETTKINRELKKLQDDFNNMNLKNHVMLKNNMKKIDLIKSVTQKRTNIIIENQAAEYLHINNFNESVDLSTLIVCNSENFKINKPLNEDTVIDNVDLTDDNSDVKEDQSLHNITNAADDVSKIKIECSISYKPVKENKCNILKTGNESPKVDILNLCQNDLENHVSDLQDLLVMMALNKTDEKELPNNEEFSVTLRQLLPESKNNSNKTSPREPNPKYESNDISGVLNVTSLRLEYNERLKIMLLKYINKWKSYVLKRKDYINQQRQLTLNSFFEKLAKKMKNVTEHSAETQQKAKLQARDYNTYQHRYKIQKHIIALQKAKLEEQNRLIEELKYNKIVEASKQSVESMKEEIRKTYFEVDRHLKPKIKCLTNELKIPEIEEQALVLHCLKVPQFLQRMEKRAREREQKHAMIRERRQQMEEERIRLKQQAELAKAEMDKEEKLKRMKELKNKRKREKIEGIRKKQYAERMRSLTVMADLYYEKTLTMKYGIAPFRKLIEMKRDNIEKAKYHYEFQLKKNVFLNWMWHTEDMWYERNYKAETLYKRTILRKVFKAIVLSHQSYVHKKQVAEDYYDFLLSKMVFKKFQEGILISMKERAIKWNKAVLYHNSIILFKTFICWRSLPALNALRREQEARKARWRQKVLQVVPDYMPPED